MEFGKDNCVATETEQYADIAKKFAAKIYIVRIVEIHFTLLEHLEDI